MLKIKHINLEKIQSYLDVSEDIRFKRIRLHPSDRPLQMQLNSFKTLFVIIILFIITVLAILDDSFFLLTLYVSTAMHLYVSRFILYTEKEKK